MTEKDNGFDFGTDIILIAFIVFLIPLGLYRLKYHIVTVGTNIKTELLNTHSGFGYIMTGQMLLAVLIYRFRYRKKNK